MNESPRRGLVKAVITTYNRREWLRLAVESVLAQTYADIHIVVVDDASPDATVDLLREYEAAYPGRFTVVAKQVNRGLADSTRVGIVAGPDPEFVAFLDDDDLWTPDLVEREVKLFRQDPTLGLVYSDATVIDVDGEPTGASYLETSGRYRTGSLAEVTEAPRACSATLMVTWEIAQRVAQTLPDNECWDWFTLMIAAGYATIGYIDAELACYRESGSGMHTNAWKLHRQVALVRSALFDSNPLLVASVGGPRAARRLVAVGMLTDIRGCLRARSWRSLPYLCYMLAKQRQLRPMMWLPIHTVRTLLEVHRDERRRS